MTWLRGLPCAMAVVDTQAYIRRRASSRLRATWGALGRRRLVEAKAIGQSRDLLVDAEESRVDDDMRSIPALVMALDDGLPGRQLIPRCQPSGFQRDADPRRHQSRSLRLDGPNAGATGDVQPGIARCLHGVLVRRRRSCRCGDCPPPRHRLPHSPPARHRPSGRRRTASPARSCRAGHAPPPIVVPMPGRRSSCPCQAVRQTR